VNPSILKVYLNMFHQVPSPKSLSFILHSMFAKGNFSVLVFIITFGRIVYYIISIMHRDWSTKCCLVPSPDGRNQVGEDYSPADP
jgi:hypothetical protein